MLAALRGAYWQGECGIFMLWFVLQAIIVNAYAYYFPGTNPKKTDTPTFTTQAHSFDYLIHAVVRIILTDCWLVISGWGVIGLMRRVLLPMYAEYFPEVFSGPWAGL